MSRPHDLYRRSDGNLRIGPHLDTGVRAQREDEASAKTASALLRDATIRAIMAHADDLGTDVDTAASFLLSWGRA